LWERLELLGRAGEIVSLSDTDSVRLMSILGVSVWSRVGVGWGVIIVGIRRA
jgi:hypothetical protein